MKATQYIAAIILILWAMQAPAQSAYLFNQSRGLSNSLINDIDIDCNGHIWISTIDGLNIYNGRTFSKCDIKYSNTNKTYQMPNHDVMIATNKGVILYDYNKSEYREIPFQTSKKDFTPFITDITGNDTITYLTTSGFGLYTLRQGDSLIRSHSLNGMLDNQFLKSIFIDSRGRIWIGTFRKETYMIQNHQLIPCPPLPDEIGSFHEDQDGNIYAASTNSGISIISPSGKNTERLSLNGIGENYPASSMCISHGRVLIGTDGLGLWEYNPHTRESHQIDASEVPFDFSKSKIHDIATDIDGNIWLGVYNKGLMLINKESSIFQNYGYRPNSPNNIGSNSIAALATSGSDIWLGTEGDGIFILPASKTAEHIDVYGSHGRNVPCNIISMYNQDNKYMWIGTYNNDFIKIDIATRKIIKIYNLPCEKISSITCGGPDKLLITSLGNGIGTFNTSTETFEKGILVNPSWGSCISLDAQKNFWIGTYDGLWYVDRECKYSKKYTAAEGFLPDNTVTHIFINRQNQIWCATNNGIMILNPMTEEYSHILQGCAVCSIVEDAMGMIWISTRDGLIRYNPADRRTIKFGVEDGLYGTEFSTRAGVLTEEGMACFGGVMGITIIKTNILTDSVTPGRVVLRRLLVNNQYIETGKEYNGMVILNKNISDVDTIYLHESENTFTLRFGTSNPAHLEQTTFRYRMLGFDSTFTQLPKGVYQTSYTNMPHGTYHMELEANIGNRGSSTRRITIIIHPLWYHTIVAKVSLALIILLILYLIFENINEKVRRRHSDQINEMKMQFFINISHEIRTPLTLIIDPLEKLLTRNDTDPETARLYSIMKTNSQRILRLVSQLLDLRKIDKGQVMMKYGKTELYPFIREIVDSCGPLIETKEISVEISNTPGIYAWVDPENFEKIILNLLHNAVKFTPVGGEIDIDITDDKDAGRILITVQDNGIGINQDDITKIFQRFYQVKSQQNRYTTGTGVGLHLARYLTELHGGKLKAENRTDKQGSRFTIELPSGKEHLPADDIIEEVTAETTSAATHELAISFKKKQLEIRGNGRKTIYVVDDEESIRTYLLQELEDDYNIVGYENGRLALDAISTQKPDLIISDIMMPEMDGWTLCRKVKRNYKTSHIPVVLLTALGDDRNKAQGIEIGADMYLEKPFNTEILKKIIRTMLINRDKVIANITNKADNYNIENIEIKSQDEILMQKVMQIIKDKISCRDLNVEMLADTIGISRVHLHRKIKEITGLSARDYLKNIRMKQASYLLTDKSLTISEIAYAVGYSNPGHFSSSFKAFYGVSPTEYADRYTRDTDTDEGNTAL